VPNHNEIGVFSKPTFGIDHRKDCAGDPSNHENDGTFIDDALPFAAFFSLQVEAPSLRLNQR